MTPYKKRLNPFIQRMAEDMQLRNLADSTIDAYESVSNSWEAAVSPVHRASLAKPVLGPTFTSGPAGRPRNPTGPHPHAIAARRRWRGDEGDACLRKPVLKHGPSIGFAGNGP